MMRTGANVLPAVPTLLGAIARAKNLKPEQLAKIEARGLRRRAAAQRDRARPSRRSRNALLAEGYGLTEASPGRLLRGAARAEQADVDRPAPARHRHPLRRRRHRQAVVALGERGELQVKGPQVMLGYYDDAEATEAAFMDGWLRTGDVGYMDEDGYVFLVDRIKDLIICSGFNVYPRTIEEALMRRIRRSRRTTSSACPTSIAARRRSPSSSCARARPRPSRSSRPSSAKSSTSSKCPRRSSSRTSCPRR